jgi:hypothetical protein
MTGGLPASQSVMTDQDWFDTCSEEGPGSSGRERMRRDLVFHEFPDCMVGNEPLAPSRSVSRVF